MSAGRSTTGRRSSDVMEGDRLPSSFTVYDSVVWVVDDEVALGGHLDDFARKVAGPRGRRGAPHLLAPALPAHVPSRVLTSLAERQSVFLPVRRRGRHGAGALAVLDRQPLEGGRPARRGHGRRIRARGRDGLARPQGAAPRRGARRARRSSPHALGHGDPGRCRSGAGAPLRELDLGAQAVGSRWTRPSASTSSRSIGRCGHADRGYAAIREPELRFTRFAGAVVASVARRRTGGVGAAARRASGRSQADKTRLGKPRRMERDDAAAGA